MEKRVQLRSSVNNCPNCRMRYSSNWIRKFKKILNQKCIWLNHKVLNQDNREIPEVYKTPGAQEEAAWAT